MNFVSLVEFWARTRPQAVALADSASDRSWTWSDLAAAVRTTRDDLSGLGARSGDAVALLDRNTPEFVVTFLSLLAHGCVAVPLNTRHDAAELGFVIADSGASMLLHGDAFEDVVSALASESGHEGGPLRTVRMRYLSDRGIDASSGPDSAHDDLGDLTPASNDDTAALLYTSGSSGRPKGVPYRHAMLRDYGAGLSDFFRLSSSDVGLAVSPLFHMSGQLVLTACISAGSTLVLMPKWDVERFAHSLDAYCVTFMHMITTLIVDVTKAPAGTFDTDSVKTVRQTWAGGGAASAELFRQYEARVGGAVCEGWGRSEGGLSWNRPWSWGYRQDSHGQVMRNICDVAIMDERGRLVPPNVEGEIVARGDTVIDGYWRRPDLWDALTTPDGWLRTGDMGLIDEDGFLQFRGRIDHMIKTGGENVYPAEVEASLLSIEGVRDAAVFGVPDQRLGNRVSAALVLGQGITEEHVDAACRDVLAGYKRPRRYFLLEAIPRLGNQKCDYVALKELIANVDR